MYKIILTFNTWSIKESKLDINEIINNNPIKHKANGSVVNMKDSDPWLDYINVEYDELQKLIKYIEQLKSKDISVKIQYKGENYNNLSVYNI
jgi:hypothetical protein